MKTKSEKREKASPIKREKAKTRLSHAVGADADVMNVQQARSDDYSIV